MKLKKWLAVFLSGCLAVSMSYALFNIVVDPFGVFGDHFFNWYAYDLTQNPRAAKIAWLNRHHTEYDSYVIGSSKASSLSCEKLNEYLDARFYNLTWYGGKVADECAAATYLLEHFEVRNLVLLLEPQNAQDFRTDSTDLKERMHCAADGSSPLLFYGSYLFCHPSYAADKLEAWLKRGYLVEPAAVYLPETGVYNKQRRDIEPISVLEDYMEKDGGNFPTLPPVTSMPFTAPCMDAVRELKALCEQKQVNLIVLLAPQYQSEFLAFDREQLAAFWRGLAAVTDFWDFSGLTPVSSDPRFFYDAKHFRNCVGDMALARIFDDTSVYIPADFGVYVTSQTIEARLQTLWEPSKTTTESVSVPILMYHSLTEDPASTNGMTMTVEHFRAQMQTMYDAGWQTVTYGDLLRYVCYGTALPAKPFILAFDDGYANNLTLGAPLLKEFGYSMQIAVIGCSAGKDTYKDTGEAMTPHFSIQDARPWTEAGVVYLNSHSYDLHQVAARDGENCRPGVLPLPGESETDYINILRNDYTASAGQLAPASVPDEPSVFTYPYGKYCELAEAVLREMGVEITVSTDTGIAEIVCGLPQSLRVLDRLLITEEVSPAQLLALVGD